MNFFDGGEVAYCPISSQSYEPEDGPGLVVELSETVEWTGLLRTDTADTEGIGEAGGHLEEKRVSRIIIFQSPYIVIIQN